MMVILLITDNQPSFEIDSGLSTFLSEDPDELCDRL